MSEVLVVFETPVDIEINLRKHSANHAIKINLRHKVVGAANSWINSKAKRRSERFVTSLAKNLPKHELDDDKVDQHTMEDLESLALGTLHSEHLSEFSKVSAWVFDPGKSWDGLASFLLKEIVVVIDMTLNDSEKKGQI